MSKVGLVGIESDFQSSFITGPAQAPDLIREALLSDSANSFAELGCDVLNHEDFTDLGNWQNCQHEAAYFQISDRIKAVLESGLTPVSLGGDHSVTYPIVKAISERYERFSILHFDAHPDLYDELEGNRYSHACPFARIMELGRVERLIQLGIRTLNDHQREQVKKFDVECYPMSEFDISDIQLQLAGPVYVSIDMDALDPAFAPGVSHHEPGGLTTRDILNTLQELRDSNITIIGADVVEYNPTRDINNMTAMVAAKFVKELAGLILTQ